MAKVCQDGFWYSLTKAIPLSLKCARGKYSPHGGWRRRGTRNWKRENSIAVLKAQRISHPRGLGFLRCGPAFLWRFRGNSWSLQRHLAHPFRHERMVTVRADMHYLNSLFLAKELLSLLLFQPRNNIDLLFAVGAISYQAGNLTSRVSLRAGRADQCGTRSRYIHNSRRHAGFRLEQIPAGELTPG
jgi:hypothetical protein